MNIWSKIVSFFIKRNREPEPCAVKYPDLSGLDMAISESEYNELKAVRYEY